MKWKITPYPKGVLHGACPLSIYRRVPRVNMWFKCLLWSVTVLKMLLRFSRALDAIAWTVLRLCVIALFRLKYAYPVIFFFLMALVVFWTMNDLQCTKILPAHSEERRQFRLVYAKTLRSAVISCYFCLSQTLVINLRNLFYISNFFLTFLLFRCEKLVFVGLSRLWYQGFSLHHFIYLQKGTRTKTN